MASLLGNTSFFTKKSLIGMVHVQALPGTPANRYSLKEIIEIAVREAQILEAVGFDMIEIENMHDTPYLRRNVGPEIVASMTAICAAVRGAIHIPFGLLTYTLLFPTQHLYMLGIQILAGANKEAIAVALATGASFIRSEGFVFSTVADEGIMDSDAGFSLPELLHVKLLLRI